MRLTAISEGAFMAMQVPFKRHVMKISEAERDLEGTRGTPKQFLKAS